MMQIDDYPWIYSLPTVFSTKTAQSYTTARTGVQTFFFRHIVNLTQAYA